MKKTSRAGRSAVAKILAIDVGGTGLKAAIVDTSGPFLSPSGFGSRRPSTARPKTIVPALLELVAPLKGYDHVSIGFPGYVRDGKVFTAPNLDTKDWTGFHLARAIEKGLGRPTRLNNDADVQGLAVIKGKGLELVCTLGTGFGTAWFRDGELMPHMELAHMPIHHKKDFDGYIGERERKKIGDKEWNKRMKKVIPMLATVMNYDHLYLGGGNSDRITIQVAEAM